MGTGHNGAEQLIVGGNSGTRSRGTEVVVVVAVMELEHWFSKCGPRANGGRQKHFWRPAMNYS